ncbi:MAG TPA: hypothetical protein IAB84_09050 [Candidatus Choladousia intestinigallinarum]|nr:hypothetical protein [Candidatus Choladousia intestinigallinarum]
MKKKMGVCFLGCFLLSALLSGCSAIRDLSEFDFSDWESRADRGEHDCRIIVRDGEGEIVGRSSEPEVIRTFAALVDKLMEDQVDLSFRRGEDILYQYDAWDNDKKISFFLFDEGEVLSCGVGSMQVYFTLTEDQTESLLELAQTIQ